jgi:hypothetical protein
LYEAAQNFEVFSNIQNLNKKIKKIIAVGCCPFQGLSNGTRTTLMKIQSGRTVPLKTSGSETVFLNCQQT